MLYKDVSDSVRPLLSSFIDQLDTNNLLVYFPIQSHV